MGAPRSDTITSVSKNQNDRKLAFAFSNEHQLNLSLIPPIHSAPTLPLPQFYPYLQLMFVDLSISSPVRTLDYPVAQKLSIIDDSFLTRAKKSLVTGKLWTWASWSAVLSTVARATVLKGCSVVRTLVMQLPPSASLRSIVTNESLVKRN